MSKHQKRTKMVNRAIHSLFWQATFQGKLTFFSACFLRIIALILYNIFIPLLIAYALEAIVTRHFGLISGFVWQIIIIAAAYGLFWGLGGYVISKNGIAGASYVQSKVFTNYLHKDHEFYSNSYFGALGAQIARLRDSYIRYCQIFTVVIPRQLVIIGAGIIVIAWQSVVLALVTLVGMLLVLAFTMLSSKWRLRFRRKVSESSSEVAAMVGDALTHAQTVKAFANEELEVQRLEKTLATWRYDQFRSWVSSIPADMGQGFLVALVTAVLLLVTSQLYQDNTISIAMVALIQLYVVRMIASTQEIAEIVKSYEEVMAGAYQPVRTMLIAPTITDVTSAQKVATTKKMAVDFHDVTFAYDDASRPALAGFSLSVPVGEKIGLVGYSGSGKTTLIKLLLRFIEVTDGDIKVNGKNIRQLSQQQLRRHIAYVPQEPSLFHRSIFENIAYGNPEATRAQILAAANLAYVDEFVQELPEGYDTIVGERGVKLSGGQRQRVAIARAIVKDAPILVLDEATSALDSHGEQRIQAALWNLLKGRTALVIAHRLSTIQHMDSIVVIDKSEVAQQGSHTQLLREGGIYAQLWAHQSDGYIGDVS